MKNMGIKLKLIILFIVIKVIPLIIVAYVAIEGSIQLNKYFSQNTQHLFNENKKLIESTASNAIEDSIHALDKKSQESLEKLSVSLASSVAEFLYERDKDILFLSKLPLNQNVIENFYNSKYKTITTHDEYTYDDVSKKWVTHDTFSKNERSITDASLKDNAREFHYVDPIKFHTKQVPIYKEVSFINLNGKEIYKKSTISNKKLDVSKKQNTYIKAETYFDKLNTLKHGEIYVSEVIGAYVHSKVIGKFTKEKAKKMGVEFRPENHGYAGLENPKGKKFDAIVRFITPVYENNKKVGYISLALDHRHIMEYTDNFDPINPNIKQNIANAGAGNYAFMWDQLGRNIAHPRDYFSVGFDPKTGKRVAPWVSADIAKKFKESGKEDLNAFLQHYPTFENQSLKQKPNISQLKQSGELGLDCRYLNFAPQCQGWMQVTQNGGYGSFVIYWSKVWKLTTAATIPYYTGQYGATKRGFGFVTIGANVDEFHEAANKTKENIDNILKQQNKKLEEATQLNDKKISNFISTLINELSFMTFLMVVMVIFIAIWMSNYITQKIQKLIFGTEQYSNNNLDYQIEVTSKDEIGKLESAFNDMAMKIKEGIQKQKEKEAQLIQKSKMAEMGDMMGAIIHQWRQPLAAIALKTSSMKLSIELDQEISKNELKEAYNDIDNQVAIMTQTVEDFRNFFKPTPEKEYGLISTVNNSYSMLKGVYKSKGVTINFLKTKDSQIVGYPNELMQVIINILNNARDAILENDSEAKIINLEVTSDEKYGIITISDLAGGIPEDILQDIFKPYFTTKSEHIGTGVGLDMSLQIINKANGTISAKNIMTTFEQKEYKGAMFTIKLPIKGHK
jgi:nitrogen fixation/metabolism regulation signal transduction histidine kinase